MNWTYLQVWGQIHFHLNIKNIIQTDWHDNYGQRVWDLFNSIWHIITITDFQTVSSDSEEDKENWKYSKDQDIRKKML